MKKFYIAAILSILTMGCFAQVKGTIIDENGHGIPFVNAVLLQPSDSAYVAGSVTSNDGRFTLTGNLESNKQYILRLSFIGYNTTYKNVSNPSDVGVISLTENASMMEDVEVKVERPKTRITADAFVTDVEGTMLENMGDVYDMLKHVAGVTVNKEDITVIGAGAPLVYVNNRLVRNKDELHQLMADQVKSVEVVNSPGARYDASVPAVIRIIKKREAGDGFRLDLKGTGEYSSGCRGWTTGTSDMIGFRKNGWDISARYTNRYISDMHNIRAEERHTYGINHLTETSQVDASFTGLSHNVTTELSYEFDADNSLGIRYDADFSPNGRLHDTANSFLYVDNVISESSTTLSNNHDKSSSHYLNLYYVGKKNGWDIDFNADAYWNYDLEKQAVNSFWASLIDNNGIDIINSNNEKKNSLFAGKFIVEHGLWKGNLSFGVEASYASHYDSYTEYAGKIEPAETKLIEDDEAVFAEYKRSFGPLIALAGVRYEHVGNRYYSFGEYQKDQSRQYHNVFPRINLSLPIKNFNFSLSYRSTIERPSFYFLSNNLTYVNRYLYYQGNPYLKPAYSHDITFNAAYKWIIFTASYNNYRDEISLLMTSFNPESAVVTEKYMNIDPINSINLDLNISPTIKFWTPDLTVSMTKQWYKQEFCGGYKELNKPHFYVNLINTFELKHNWLVDVTYWFSTKGDVLSYEYTKFYQSLDFSIRKGFLNDKLRLTLSGEDLLGTQKPAMSIFGSIYKHDSRMTSNQRSISLTLRYTFNSAESKYKGSGAGTDQKDRMH